MNNINDKRQTQKHAAQNQRQSGHKVIKTGLSTVGGSNLARPARHRVGLAPEYACDNHINQAHNHQQAQKYRIESFHGYRSIPLGHQFDPELGPRPVKSAPAAMSEKRWVWTIGAIPLGGAQGLSGLLPGSSQPEPFWTPNADVYAEPTRIQVVLELPGVNPDRVDVRYDSAACILSVTGSREPRGGECCSCQQLELYYGPFSREIQLPQVAVMVERISAKYDDGLLTISLPVSPVGNSEHTIKVESN